MKRPWRNCCLWTCWLMACSAYFLKWARTTSPGVAPSAMGWTILHQSLVKKMSHKLSHRPTWWGHFFQLMFSLPQWLQSVSSRHKAWSAHSTATVGNEACSFFYKAAKSKHREELLDWWDLTEDGVQGWSFTWLLLLGICRRLWWLWGYKTRI